MLSALSATQDMRQVKFTTQREHYLWGFTFETLSARTLAACVKTCLARDPLCISVNYRLVTEECTLNNGTHREFNYYHLPNAQYPNLIADVETWMYAFKISD